MGKLFVIATPLGNLEDISARALATLREADLVLCEDTRVGGKLLHLYGIEKPLQSYHQHSNPLVFVKILQKISDGGNVALITDAGTPGISDPGNELISMLLEHDPHLSVVPVPGASSVTALLSVSGFDCAQFTFIGFFPRKKKTKVIQEILLSHRPIVFFESPHRIVKTLGELAKTLELDRKIVVGRELTKMYETLYRGTAESVQKDLLSLSSIKGEIVVVVNKASKNSPT